MRLKHLEVRGFKSFADRTEFDFDRDLTGIVGPNGCGKSNVVDALKWVLGDQRAKSLRSAEMTDVIFKGAEGRDAMAAAEVTVELEDYNGLLGDRERVRIGRKLTRDKESHYLIDGEPVRLKDVRDLLLDTGLGVGAYSVMEQGRIDAVLSANPESRRAIFEEAAGISRFKLQKRETLRKLDRTEVNLARVQDLLEERSRRIRGLRIQAGRARRYRELRGSLRDVKAAVAVVDGRGILVETESLRTRLLEFESSLADFERNYAESSERVAEQDRSILEVGGRVEESQEQLREVRSRREQLDGKRVAFERREEELQIDADGCVARVAELDEQRVAREREVESNRDEIERLEQMVIELHKACEDRRDAVRDAQRLVGELLAAREGAREAVLECLHARTRNRNAVHDQASQKRSASAASQRLETRISDIDLDRATQRAEADARRAELEVVGTEVAELKALERVELAELEQADTKVADLARGESKQRESLASVRSRLDVLEGMEAHFEGLDQGPKFLLERAPTGLQGRLLDLLEIPFDESKALEAALGSFVQALVVDTRSNAEAMLDLLAEQSAGRAMLLIEEEFSSDFGTHGPALPPPEGAVALADLVVCPDSARPLARWLLRGVMLTDSLEQARIDRPDLCYVTRTGRLLCGPKIEGGAGEGQGGLVVRRAQIHRLAEAAEVLDRELAALRSELELGTERASALKHRVRELGEQRASLRERDQQLRSTIGHVESRVADLERQRQTYAAELRDATKQRYGALAMLSTLMFDGLLATRSEQLAERAEADTRAAFEAASSAHSAASIAEQEVRVQHASVRSEREAGSHRLETLEQALVELRRASADLDERRVRAVDGAEEARAQVVEVASALEEADQQIESSGEVAAEFRAALDDARSLKSEQQELHREAERQRDGARTSIGETKLAVADAEHRFLRIEERLREDAEIELQRCLGRVRGRGIEVREVFGPPSPADAVEVLQGPPLPATVVEAEVHLSPLWLDPEFDVRESRKHEKVLQSQIDRLGAVNLDAVGELEDEESNFDQLERDVEDLNEARKSLVEALRQMEDESRGLFERTFAEARENFRTIFRKLFQGGRADMYLAEGEDSLEGGIEIVAKPPGKELQSIALLSGGERSLTALAILFAVFKVKPSPFCILDEVDAALDETNVERFLRVLDDFVGESQFCIVTHHKRTMAHCQSLYGVTMQRRGVSTRIGVSLEEVDSFTEAVEVGGRGTDGDVASKQRVAGEERVEF